jgi:hypothetical protein
MISGQVGNLSYGRMTGHHEAPGMAEASPPDQPPTPPGNQIKTIDEKNRLAMARGQGHRHVARKVANVFCVPHLAPAAAKFPRQCRHQSGFAASVLADDCAAPSTRG